ncbi:hypothetical protein GIX45_06715 [Erwinia sp. CPCC 100877]|nr:hypothetical protein [Erwinia sp. CPCC 100877]
MKEKIKFLRDKTNNIMSISDCKKFLLEANGDVGTVIDMLVKSGIDLNLESDEYTVVLELRKKYTLGQLIDKYGKAVSKIQRFDIKDIPKIEVIPQKDESKEYYQKSDYCIYTEKSYPQITANMICYLERSYEMDDKNTKYYPIFCEKNQLYEWYLPEIYEDVVSNLLLQKKQPTMDDYIFGLKYYLENDTFFSFE